MPLRPFSKIRRGIIAHMDRSTIDFGKKRVKKVLGFTMNKAFEDTALYITRPYFTSSNTIVMSEHD
jgi:hypothetical protein